MVIITALSAIGVILQVLLTHHFYTIRSGAEHFRSFCNVGEKVNCDVIALNSFAEFIPGIPLSSLGAGLFAAILILSVLARLDDWREEGAKGIWVLSLFGVVVSLFYLGVMLFSIKTLCLLCLATDATMLAIAIASTLLIRKISGPRLPSRAGKISGIWVACTFVLLIAMKGLDTNTLSANDLKMEVDSLLSSPIVNVPVTADTPAFGPANAPITIVEFSDFQCPFCAQAAKTLHLLMGKYPEKIRVVFKNFPLDPKCNSKIQGEGHAASCEAAKAAFCSSKKGKFEGAYQFFFEHQTQLQPGKVSTLTQDATGLASTEIETCLNSADAHQHVIGDVQDGLKLGVESTPTFFVNGQKLMGGYPITFWIQVIDRLLEQKK